ncbi:DUF1796 family putative cysteine peptidase [Estrella lausannensis]|nr:DUF1796 family putative cysteine peptidase [Estrella lausannensis]
MDEKEIEAGIDFESTEPLFISLGSICRTASSLKEQGLRKASFPFDWYLSVDGEKMIEIIKDDFRYFFNRKYLTPFVTGVLLNTYYHFEFSHEGIWANGLVNDQFIKFYEKYYRRIERFRKLGQYQGKLFFVRSAWPLSTHPNYAFSDQGNLDISLEYAERLHTTLQSRFPKSDVYLIIQNGRAGEQDDEVVMVGKIAMVRKTLCSYQSVASILAE